MPDYFRGLAANTLKNPKEFLKSNSDWNGQLKEDFLKVKEYGKNLNPKCKTFGTIGTCWGTYPVIRMSEDVEIKVGISMHPSHPNVIGTSTTHCGMRDKSSMFLSAVFKNLIFLCCF